MTQLVVHAGAAIHVAPRRGKGIAVFRAAALLIFFALLFFSLVKVSEMAPAYHIGFHDDWRELIFIPVCLTIAIGSAFVFANFSFGYFAGFYLFTMMAGYFWLNTFSVLAYDHATALISAAVSIVLFLLPSLMILAPIRTFALSRTLFDRLPEQSCVSPR